MTYRMGDGCVLEITKIQTHGREDVVSALAVVQYMS
jgi:hypothetical protein